nr:MAG: replication initiator protein [Microviridae sp.]
MPQCLTTYYLKDQDISVPCGRCPNCAVKRASMWSFRLCKELEVSTSAFFLTLTYTNDNVPLSDKGRMTLCKSDVQLFIKRLRQNQKRYAKKHSLRTKPIRYFSVGEYGSKRWRPHYHLILFNAMVDPILMSWTLGEMKFGTVNESSVGYTLKYISKTARVPQYQGDDRLPEFSHFSKGLGANYLTDNMKAWHRADMENRMYVNVIGGKVAAMPRYYKLRIYSDDELPSIGVASRKSMLERMSQDRRSESQKNAAKFAAFRKQKKQSDYGQF